MQKNKTKKSKMIRISQEIHDSLREIAKNERRTLTACVEVLIEEKHKTLDVSRHKYTRESRL